MLSQAATRHHFQHTKEKTFNKKLTDTFTIRTKQWTSIPVG